MLPGDWKQRLRARAQRIDPERELPRRKLFPELNPHLPPDFVHRGRLREASVLIPIVDRGDEPTVIFIERAADMPMHGGEIGFPGGGRHAEDADHIQTALRETEEEIGVPPDAVDLAGQLRVHEGGRGFVVRPVIGVVDPNVRIRPDPREVAAAFEAPLRYLLDPANHRIETRKWGEADVRFYAVPYGDRHIWGLTAGLLVSLRKVLHGEED